VELLDEYYRFIAAFDLIPYCKDRQDSLIDIDIDDTLSYKIADTYYPRFSEIKQNIKIADKTKIRNAVLDIIKRNTNKNIKTLNHNIYELFCKDSIFQNFIQEKRSRS
jgi:hypothetical protein